MVSRRSFLGAVGAAALLQGTPRRGWAGRRTSAQDDRRFVTICLSGGPDPLYTIDPKLRSELDADVDLPYGPAEIVRGKGVALGPSYRLLEPFADRFAVVRGVQLRSVAHETGTKQFLRLRTGADVLTPGLLDTIGRHHPRQPLGAVLIVDDVIPGDSYVPHHFTDLILYAERSSLFAILEATSHDDLARMAAALRAQAARITGGGADRIETRRALEETSALFERLRGVPKMSYGPWNTPVGGVFGILCARYLQHALWVLEHDLARNVAVVMPSLWDSHFNNAGIQSAMNAVFARAFSHFLTELGQRRSAAGPLAEHTVVVVGADMGRFPYINKRLGKDHLPEASFLLVGSGLRPGCYGHTGRRMEAAPVSLRTGAHEGPGDRQLVLDDLGGALLRLAGLDPDPLGYPDAPPEFLFS